MMMITRLDQDKNLEMDVKYLDVCINGKRYRLTESIDGKLKILCEDKVAVYPCVGNGVEIESI